MGGSRDEVALIVSRILAATCLFAAVFFGPPAASQSAARCSTFDETSEPSTEFSAGQRLTVRGSGFAPQSLVLITFIQDTRTADLGRAPANDLGAFTSTGLQIPSSVSAGKASIKALDARASATCGITLASSPAGESSDLTGLYVVWGSLLAAFAAILALLTYRRWKAERLHAEIDRLNWRESYEERREADERALIDDRPEIEQVIEPETEPPSRHTSDAIERLQREVRSWRKG